MRVELVLAALIAQAEDAPRQKTLLEHVQSGGPIGYVIILLSFLALAFAVFHLIQTRRSKLSPPAVADGLDQLLSAGDTTSALAYCKARENDCFLTRTFGAALTRCSRSAFGFLELRTALEEAGQDQTARLHRAVDWIGLIASVAPMLGLLGTVVGMVMAFETISSTEGYAKPAALASSIAVALITTVLGLIVAIPCTAAYTYFRNRIDHQVAELGEVIEELASRLQTAPTTPTAVGSPASPQPESAARAPRRQAAPPPAATGAR